MSARILLLAATLLQDAGEPVSDYAARMRPIVEATKRGEWPVGLAGLQALLDEHEAGGIALAEHERAEVWFARGFLAFQQESDAPTTVPALLAGVPSFESARALAGPGPLRLEATYDLGLAYLATGERWRAHLPEVAQRSDPPLQVPLPTPPPPSDPAAAPEQAPDPLAQARVLYGLAKEALIERLRADWRDADTRANLELIQRRLRELDEIERQREEEQQEQQQDPSQDPNDQGDQEQPGDEGQEGEPQEGDQDTPPEEQQGNPEDPKKDDEQQVPSGEERELGPEDVQPPQSGGEAESRQQTGEERVLTREEVMRLLDQLGELEDQREALEAALRQARRVPVERDW